MEKAGTLLPALETQAVTERDAFLETTEGGMWSHLARHEVMQMLEIDPAPPASQPGDHLLHHYRRGPLGRRRSTIKYRDNIAAISTLKELEATG